jgi:DNA-binding protein Fis
MKLSDLIVIMYSKGQLSEGKAASLIGVDRLTLRTMRDALIQPSEDKSEKVYSTMRLVESLHNALENGYEELGATDIGDLLLMCETGTLLNPNHEGGRTKRAADGAWDCPKCKKPNISAASKCWFCEAPRR